MAKQSRGTMKPPVQTQTRVRRGGYTVSGPQRSRNEDSYALPADWVNEKGLGTMLVVADGVGGREGGASASHEAVSYLQALYYASAGAAHPAERLKEGVEAVNAINRLKRRLSGPQDEFLTTLVAAVVHRGQIWIANVGDSRAYLVSAQTKQTRQLTEDHSQAVLKAKTNLPEEAVLERTGVIHRAIGLVDQCQVDIYHYGWHLGDCLVLCTDGLEKLSNEEMAEIALKNPPEEASRALVERAIELDGSDNCTAVVASWVRNK